MVFCDAFDYAFDQTAVASFAIFVKEGFAFGAENRDGTNVFACHRGMIRLRRKSVRAIKRSVAQAAC